MYRYYKGPFMVVIGTYPPHHDPSASEPKVIAKSASILNRITKNIGWNDFFQNIDRLFMYQKMP